MTNDTNVEEPNDSNKISKQLRRRREIIAAGVTMSALAVAGCSSSTGGGGTTTNAATTDATTTDAGEADGGEGDEEEEEEEEALPEGVSEEEFESGPVPDVYASAVSLGGEERNADELQTKDDVQFTEYSEAEEKAAHTAGASCGNCSEYIADKNGDEFGACAKVEGYIDGADWCTVYESLPEPAVPTGMSEDELGTAEVPEQYRTADSQGGEARDPENLFTHEEVSLTESVEAIESGDASPGQSCGTCAEFIPDKNGDTWGACAKVEGYIAVEDWCTVWEHVSGAGHEETTTES